MEKKKILWLCNFPTTDISNDCGLKTIVNEGWNKSLCDELLSHYRIVYVFFQNQIEKDLRGNINDLKYYGMYSNKNNTYEFDKKRINDLNRIVKTESPDLIHIMGTEIAHSLEMIKVAKHNKILDKTVVSIQGLTSACVQHYTTRIPYSVYKRKRLKDYIYKTSIVEQEREFYFRGENEKRIIAQCKNIIGRTEFDKAYTSILNSSVKYFAINEVLRSCFYGGEKWNISNIERYSIFFSQATYPIKGFHIFLEAAAILKKKYPDFKVYVAGRNIYEGGLWKKSSYEYYIRKIISNNNLDKNIVFVGEKKAEQMKDYLLKSNVFVSASTIENSPNSLGEAMILGTPIIASNVGGVNSLITHKKEGLMYQVDAPYMLAYYMDMVFSNDDLAVQMSENELCRAKDLYNKADIVSKIINLYNELSNK